MRMQAAKAGAWLQICPGSEGYHASVTSASCTACRDMHVQATKVGTRLQINPGSATGAYCSFRDIVVPSFILLDLEGSKARAVCFVENAYTCICV